MYRYLQNRIGCSSAKCLGCSLIYSLYIRLTTVATFADDTAIMVVNKKPDMASAVLQLSLNAIQEWMKLWRITANVNKSAHITFTIKKIPFGLQFPQTAVAKYLGIHLDQHLTWAPHILNKSKPIWTYGIQIHEDRQQIPILQ